MDAVPSAGFSAGAEQKTTVLDKLNKGVEEADSILFNPQDPAFYVLWLGLGLGGGALGWTAATHFAKKKGAF